MDYLIRQLLKAMGIVFRTIRVFITRRVAGLFTRFRQVTNVSRGAVKVANTALQNATNVAKTPSKREDYIAFGNLLIAKALLARIAITLGLLFMLIYFILWPLFLSRFLTARFWTEDTRVPNWSGRVIVYSDKKKTIPLYAGRLEHGLLQGSGREYDENGLLSYEGMFTNGQRSGTGAAYQNGVLCYEGQFSQGVYEGTGIRYDGGRVEYEGQFSDGKFSGRGTLYQEGVLLYEGQFDQGAYQGQGALYQAGVLEYQGAFQSGVPEGMGTSYYYDGGVRYEGQFEKGVPEGTGKYYEDGRLVYQGGFSRGLYNGSGTLYPVMGEQIDATFVDGVPDGIVRWSKGGKLYYEGEWAEDRPEGYGVLYAKSGDAAYQGAFLRGTIDGSRLLGISVDDLRKAVGESVSTAGRGGTFAVSSPQLGLTAQCTYQTADADSQVMSVYLYAPENGEGWFRLLPGMDRAALPAEDFQSGSLFYTRQDRVPLASGQYSSAQAVTEPGLETIVYQWEVPVLVRWTAVSGSGFTASSNGLDGVDTGAGGAGTGVGGTGAGAGGAGAGTGGAGAGSADGGTSAGAAALAAGVTGMDAVEDLLASLDGMESAPSPAEPAAYGTDSVGGAIAACETVDAAAALVSALSDYWLQTEMESLLTENLSWTRALLDDAQRLSSMGQSDDNTVEALAEAVRSLEDQILNCEMEKKRAEVSAQSVASADPAALDLSQMPVLFDPSTLDASELPVIAAAYAQVMGEDTDPAELALAVKSSLLHLQESYTAVQSAIRQYEAAAQAGDSAARQYAMGTGSKEAWYSALSAKNGVRAALYGSMNAFTKQAADLNRATAGWVSRTAGWYAEEFDAVLSVQFPEGLPTAEEPEEIGHPSGEAADSTDAGSINAGSTDAGSTDSGSTNAGSADSGSTDAGSADSGSTDAGSADSGSTDAGSTDSDSTDAGSTDSGSTDTGSTDSGSADAGSTDVGSADAGSTDSGNTDSGNTNSDSTDSDSADAGSTDSGSTDSGSTDAGSTDSGSTDSGSTDAGSTDSGGDDSEPAGQSMDYKFVKADISGQ